MDRLQSGVVAFAAGRELAVFRHRSAACFTTKNAVRFCYRNTTIKKNSCSN
jgi:hypothetical protein